MANCASNLGGTAVTCDTTATSDGTTNTANTSADTRAWQLPGLATATINNGATITVYGSQFENTGSTSLDVVNNGTIVQTVLPSTPGGTAALAIIGSGGAVTYSSGAGGDISSTVAAALAVSNTGAGTIDIDTGSGVISGLTGIATLAVDGLTTITTATGTTVTGTAGDGINAVATGLGGITITANGSVTGNNGLNASANTGAVLINGANGVITGSAGAGILATSAGGGVTVAMTGTAGISGSTIGIDASDTAGGAASVSTGDQAVTGNGGVGISAVATGGNGNVDVTTGTVLVQGSTGGILASAVGTGTVTVTTNGDVTGSAGHGIATSAVDGLTTITTATGTTVTGTAGDGINAVATGLGGITITANGSVTGQRGIFIDQSAGAGGTTIANAGTITGNGAAFAVIEVNSNAATTINNSVGGVIAPTSGSSGDLAIRATNVANGAFTINNSGTLTGRVNLTNAADAFNNTGIWNVSGTSNFYLGANTIGNALAGVINAGTTAASVTNITSTGTLGVTNAGTINVFGALNFTGAAGSLANTGLIDMRTAGAATTDVVTLNSAVGVGAASNTYAPGAAFNYVGGGALGLNTYVGGIGSSGANVPSDRVVISGTATGSTGIVINDTNPGGGGYNPTGMTIAAVNGASTNAFQLTGVTGGSPGEVVQPARGPMGAIKKGIWFYPLLQTTVPGDGLSAAGSEYRLFGLPDIEAFMLPYAVTGAQNVFFDTAADWLDRQDDLRRWIRRNGFRARSAAGGGADMPDRSAPGYISSTGPGVWVKAGGSWSNRKASADVGSILPAAAGLGSFDLSFKQNTYSLMGGVDFGQEAVLSPADTMVWGLMAGYIDSRLNFKNSSNSFKYTGATVGASATYLNGGWFADALIKADFLKLSLDFPSLISGGFTPTRVDATTYGLVANTGYRFQWGHRGQTYFEPGLTLAYAKTHIDNVTLMGTTAEFNKAESLRGAAGARIGTVVQETATHVVDASFYGKYWNEFTGKAGVLLTSTGPALALEDTRAKGYTDLGIIIDLANKGTGWSGFVSGGMKFNKEFSTTVVKTGIRYLW